MQPVPLEDLPKYVPTPGSEDYSARSGIARLRAYNVRKKLVTFVLDVCEKLNVLEKLSVFVRKNFKNKK